jgi:hypothetical protein
MQDNADRLRQAVAGIPDLPRTVGPAYAVAPDTGGTPAQAVLAWLAERGRRPVVGWSQPPAVASGKILVEFPSGALDASALLGDGPGSLVLVDLADSYGPLVVPDGPGPGVPTVSLFPAVPPGRHPLAAEAAGPDRAAAPVASKPVPGSGVWRSSAGPAHVWDGSSRIGS